MKPLKIFFLITFLIFFNKPGNAALSPQLKKDTIRTSWSHLLKGKLKPAEIEKLRGKKLKLKEKIALLFLKNKMKKTLDKQSHATIALILGISSISFVGAGMFFIAAPWTLFIVLMSIALILAALTFYKASKVKKGDQGHKKTVIARILAAITFAILSVVAIIGLALLAFVNSF